MDTTNDRQDAEKADAKVLLRLPPDLLTQVDAQAAAWNLSRNAALIKLLRKAVLLEQLAEEEGDKVFFRTLGKDSPLPGLLVVSDMAAASEILEILRREQEAR